MGAECSVVGSGVYQMQDLEKINSGQSLNFNMLGVCDRNTAVTGK